MTVIKDRAVRRVKALPRNRNVPVCKETYTCGRCPDFKTELLSEAWTHTLAHGPWPAADGGTLMSLTQAPDPPKDPLTGPYSPRYNRVRHIIARVEPPLIGRATVRRIK